MNEIRMRVKALRLEMLKQNLDAYYISGTDPHSSEYLPNRWKTREFITGFTGSFGVVVITQEEAGLWTDTRYFLQAEEQLKGSGIKMFKLRVPNAVSPENWLAKKLPEGSKVGIDAQSVTVNGFRSFENVLDEKGINLVKTNDLLDKIWEERPEIPDDSIFELEIKYAGLSRKEKKDTIVAELKKYNADYHIVSMLDELAWLFNLRGSDVNYNPVFTGYAAVGKTDMILFADKNKMSVELQQQLERERITVNSYDDFFPWLSELRKKSVFIDPSTANYSICETLEKSGNVLAEGTSITALLKARKNKVELKGFRQAMIKDGVALVEFLFWLKQNIGKEKITEYSVGRKLAEFRAKQQDFKGESFPPIVGYKSHGAIVHLNVGPDDALPLEQDGVLLFDSGGQYLQGTTDITRTVALGEITERQKKDFTLVLKGMIGLTLAVFPVGTKGCHLDILARKALWESGINYGHGTGHGVGHFLNVHEGPMAIRQEFNVNTIDAGMVLSNEPAMYREGQYGIRTENMIVCIEKEETEFGKFLGFDTLTLCPIDTGLVDISLLTPEEIDWINEYHQRVRKELLPFMDELIQPFLLEITKPV
ncbi:aminopeptidase P family protein [Maribellus maritimus]|uniref:aminopeptidase P family protein n=1 Tax=Maribellus maritimus TaxID=2870838 RepID=UPI001EECA3A2|nr:aminopeptidase P family protein [Maribellus maritimus]MCG6190589.1 aminopeptidase P family protein [Maribellus maritimus]